MRETKNLLYEQVSRVSKALASPKRLELIELLCQCEKSVETLARESAMSVKLASAHLRALRAGRLVETRKDGKYVLYRLADPSVADLWVLLRGVAEERLLDLQVALRSLMEARANLVGVDRKSILRRAQRGDVIVIDVRPQEEFAAGHLPFARSLPLTELKKRLKQLPTDKPVVAYCRGPFCMMAQDAVALLQKHGYRAQQLEDGVAEWRARGLPIEQ
jgi:rhodanese-related sulfurtransferase/DNA-binding transcriptional ArsR family regulator